MSDPTSFKVPRLWRSEEKSGRRDASSARRRSLFVLQAAIMALTGAIVGLLFWISPAPRPHFVPLFVARHEQDQIPSPPMAVNDLRNLNGSWYFPGLAHKAKGETLPSSLTGREFRQTLEALRNPKTDRTAPVVLYLRANAVAAYGTPTPPLPSASTRNAKKGAVPKIPPARPIVHILPADADPNTLFTGTEPAAPGDWIPLRYILEALKESPSRNKLLVLDLQPRALPRLGLVDANVAGAIDAELDDVADPYRATLTSCSPGEVPLASDDLARSVFSYYFEEGLRGYADGLNSRADGSVTARELAEFVKARVSHWARHNRGTSQVPSFTPSRRRADFTLLVLDRGRRLPHLKIPPGLDLSPREAPRKYPAWLLAGWKERDRWREDRLDQVAPWAYRAIEAYLHRAEEDWRNRVEPKEVQTALTARLGRVKKDWSIALESPVPDRYRSLAVAASLGVVPDRTLVDTVDGLVRDLVEADGDLKGEKLEDARAKRVRDFLQTVEGTVHDEVKVARAVLDVGGGRRCTPETVQALDRVLIGALRRTGKQGALPVETLTLHWLAGLSTTWANRPGQPEWPADAAQRSILVDSLAAEAGARPRAFSWVRPVLEKAETDRHDAGVLLRERGYVTLDRVRSVLDSASTGYTTTVDAARTLELARATLGSALELLSDSASRLDLTPQAEETWLSATDRARELAFLLKDRDEPFRSAGEMATVLQSVSQCSNSLSADVADVRAAVDRLIQRLLTEPEPNASLEALGTRIQEINSLLETSLPSATQRESLWLACRHAARPLLASTLEHDIELDSGDSTADQDGASEEASEEADQSESPEEVASENGTRTFLNLARRELALLGMAGAEETKVLAIQERLKTAGTPGQRPPGRLASEFAAISQAIREAWDETCGEKGDRVAARPDSVSLLLPPFDPSKSLSSPSKNPPVTRRVQAWSRFWGWLADVYERSGNDLGRDRSLTEASEWLRDFTQRTLVEFGMKPGAITPREENASPFTDLEPDAGDLSLDRRAARVLVRLKGDTATPAWEYSPIGDDDRWFRVQTDTTLPEAEQGNDRLHYLVQLTSSANETAGDPPAGFLLQASRLGQHFHQRVPLTFDLNNTQPGIFLSADPEKPAGPTAALRLRPLPGLQKYYLFLTNPIERDWPVEVEVRVGDRPVMGTKVIVILPSKATQRIEFPIPTTAATPTVAATPAAPGVGATAAVVLPEMEGPLVITLRDVQSNRLLVVRRIPVGVASPLEYVRVLGAQFDPPGLATGGKNRLTVNLRAGPSFSGPPCTARLVLSPGRVPGLTAVKDTNSQGTLSKPGDTLALTAENLAFADNDDEVGTFTIDLDGVPRALVFRAAFARSGGPTTPSLDFTPALRARADEVAASGGRFAIIPEPDSAPAQSRLELTLGRSGIRGFEAERELPSLPSARRRKIGFEFRERVLTFTADVSDWTVFLDSEGIEGRRLIRLRLIDRDGQLVRETFAPVAFDRSSPAGVRIVDNPRRSKPGASLNLRATGDPTASGTKEVVFFNGKPTADRKIPPGVTTFPARPAPDDPTAWTGSLVLPEKKGPADISVAFLNNVGLAAFDTVTLDLNDTETTSPGRIVGRVTERDVGQPELAVFLADEKGMKKAEVKTDATGKFHIDDVPPGRYRVLAKNSATPSKADVIIEVLPGRPVTADLDLRFGR